ncbi:MAG: LuxR C-terminal-related transcriptional regulator [Chloroflexota bacterium]
MPANLLVTKLYTPAPRPGMVPRPRLLEQLNAGLAAGHTLTLISASAGFGKTTLLSEWLADCGRPAAWLSLDEGDNDPARFVTYLVAALQTMGANIGAGALAVLQSPQPPPLEAMLTPLLNDLTTLTNPFILVLEDYHVIDAAAVAQALAFLVERLPPQAHLVIATREDPPLPLARLRARGRLSEVRAADLRFTPAEAAEFLNRVMGLDLSDADTAALEARTEGWIAGLQLAAIALRSVLSLPGDHDPTGFIRSFTGSHHFVLDYLLEEVLQRQPEPIQAFLLRTSILKRLCGPLCEAVLLAPPVPGQETLEYLERANLFIVPLDHERRWYRYHHLFGDLLAQRLRNRLSVGEIAESHLRASRWYEQAGDEHEAFHHAVAGADFERAAQLAEAAWLGMDISFQTAAWLGWVRKLPEEVIRPRPVLNTQVGLALMDAGEPQASELRLQAAERLLDGPPTARAAMDEQQLKPLQAMIALGRAYNAQVVGDFSATVKFAETALQHLPEDDLFRRAQATIMLGFTHWCSGDLDAARFALGDWMNSMQKAGNLTIVVASAFALADILVGQGRLREAEKTYRQALQTAAEQGPEAQQVTAHHLLGLAMLYHEQAQDRAAAEHLQKARRLGEQTTLVDWHYRWHLAQARLEEAAGHLDAALNQLDEARRVYVRNPVPDIRPIEALKANLYLKQGRLARALDWARERGLSAEDEIGYLGEFEHLTLARALLAGYQSRQDRRAFLQALGLLERLLKAAESQTRNGSVIEILAVQALAHQAQGNLPLALASLERALLLAQPEGFVRIFVGEGEPMRLLIAEFRTRFERQAIDQGQARLDYAGKILAAFQEADAPPGTRGPEKPGLVEPLSERELEVLRLLAQGLTNHEISRRLVVALSTVKGHNLRIFGKLQAQNRTEAVARARELGLL